MENKIKRDPNIDFYRGLAVLGIIAIHTAFHSGTDYVPDWFKSLTLLIDVSYFFFISGKSMCFYEGDLFKTSKSLFKTWLKWIYGITILFVISYIIGSDGIKNIRELFQGYFFNLSFPSLKVLAESTWFMPYYFVIVLINQIILSAMSVNKEKYEKYKKWYCGLLLVLFVWIITENDFFGINQYYFFYSFFLIFGLLSSVFREKILQNFVISIVFLFAGYIVSCYLMNMPLLDLQSSKFPPNLPYLFASMLIIFMTMFFDEYIKSPNKFIVHIGKNAIFYFIAQGVGGSLIYFVVPELDIGQWFIKWIIVFFINTLITISTAELLSFTYNLLSKFKVLCVNKIINK